MTGCIPGCLRLKEGDCIEDLSEANTGRSHRVLFGIDSESGCEVVAKIELLAGRLETEHRALTWLSAHGAPVPPVHRWTQCFTESGALAPCLVLKRVQGRRPCTPAAWRRIGCALAAIARLPWQGSELTLHEQTAFVQEHLDKVRTLGSKRLAPVLGAALDAHDLLHEPFLPSGPLVLTHGDPGGGNYLDDGRLGTLLDWEKAQIAPQGLDVGRAMFIALLDATAEGRPSDVSRARAVEQGYAEASGWTVGRSELRWWLAVAGVQLIEWRWRRHGQPRVLPWRDAVDVLAHALSAPAWSRT